MSPVARIVFLIRIPTERTEEFLAAYHQVRYAVANGVDGHLLDQVCRSDSDPEQWLITSEWESLAHFVAWETTPEHRVLVRPMRECMTEARSMRFEVQAATRRGDVALTPALTTVQPGGKPMNTAQTVLAVWTLAAAGVQLGTLWIMKTSIIPMLDALPYNRYVTTCQLIDMHMFHPIAVWNGVIAAGIGIWAAAIAPTSVAATLFVLGSIAMVTVGLTSEIFNRPIWRQIEHWSPRRTTEQWDRKRVRWHVAHEVRTWAAIVAMAAFVSAFLAQAV